MSIELAAIAGLGTGWLTFLLCYLMFEGRKKRKESRESARQERYDRFTKLKDRMFFLQDPARPEQYQSMRMMRELAHEVQNLSEKI